MLYLGSGYEQSRSVMLGARVIHYYCMFVLQGRPWCWPSTTPAVIRGGPDLPPSPTLEVGAILTLFEQQLTNRARWHRKWPSVTSVTLCGYKADLLLQSI